MTLRSSRVALLSAGFTLGIALSVEPAPIYAQTSGNEVFASDDWWDKNDKRAPQCSSLNSAHRDLTQQLYQSRNPEANQKLAPERGPIHDQLIDCLAQALDGNATKNVEEPETYPDPQAVPDPNAPLTSGVQKRSTKNPPTRQPAPRTQTKPSKVLYGEGSIWWQENGERVRLKYKLNLDLNAEIEKQEVTNTKIEGSDKVRFKQGKAVIVGFKGKRISKNQFQVTGVWVKPHGKNSDHGKYFDVNNEVVDLEVRGQ